MDRNGWGRDRSALRDAEIGVRVLLLSLNAFTGQRGNENR